ncbi:xanthine dehydrogenase-like [Cydia strobilella]|uniref:xanthine dehydrogenase-like n=1 Tax=Cydia strobilella TaxID=1100964 RepID=UPI003007B736
MNQTELSLPEFLTTNIVGRVMTQIKLPPLSRHHDIVTYKIPAKEQNAHAEVNGAFLFKFDPKSHKVIEASIVYGGINPTFTHAYNTEQFLIGRNLFTNDTLQGALHCLEKEVDPNFNPPEPKPHFRKKLALGLFYKAVIKLCPREILSPKYASGATTAYEDRPPVSRSYQEYDTNRPDYPITQPLLKKEGLIQCAGAAKYADDIPRISDEVFASFIVSTIARGEIENIDYADVLKIEGVIAVYTSKDIPGVNSIVRGDFQLLFENEELFADDKIYYYNQPVGLVVAETQVIADKAACLVTMKYKNISKKPIIFTIQDAIDAPPLENRLITYEGITPSDRGVNVQRIIKGSFYSPRQYHHMMELHATLTSPVDNGYEIDCSTQWMDITQAAIAQLLNIPNSLVRVRTRRCGGAFGCKIARNMFAACGTALVAYKLNRPCRIAMRMPDIMRITGKRPDSRLDYEVAVDGNGQIQYLDGTFYVNDGMSRNENENSYVTDSMKNCYNPDRWKVDSFGAITDAPTNCFMRAPGNFEGIAAIEHIMEHIAKEIKRDPIEVRFNNYRVDDNQLPEIVPEFLKKSDFNKRLEYIKEFNAKNRWKKRGLKLNNMAFPTQYLGNYGALVSIYHGDGSVAVNIGGIEIGQGINTRIAQVAASELKVPVEKVHVLSAYDFATPNNFSTASSITTECCALSVIRCCQQLNARLAPFRALMPDATWEQVVFEADLQGVLLQANFETSPNDPRLQNYSIFGVAATEVEIDVLTGTKYIVRADIFEDAGRTINPALDVGQASIISKPCYQYNIAIH